MLSGEIIKDLILRKGMIQGYIDLEKQLQVNGFDVTVKKVERIHGDACIGFTEKTLPGYILVDMAHTVLFPNFYLVTLNEQLDLPLDISAQILSRTSLIRSGGYIIGGWFDRGYKGTPQIGMRITSPIDLKPNARIAQLAFTYVYGSNNQGYNGSYQGMYP